MNRKEKRYERRLRMLKDKKYIRMEQDLYEKQAIASTSYIEEPLNPPVFNGYVRYYVVRKDLENTKEGKDLKRVLTYVGFTQFCRDKSFTFKSRKLRSERKRLKKEPLDLKPLSEAYFEKKVPDDLKKYFDRVRSDNPGWNWNEHYVYRCNVPMWKFSEKIDKHYLYSTKVLVGSAESDYESMRLAMWRDNLWTKVYKARSRSYNHKDWYGFRKIEKLEKILSKETASFEQY